MAHRPRPAFARAYSFGIVTAVLFLLAWSGQFVFQLMVVQREAQVHGQAFSWSDFWPQFLSSTLENWQSAFLQLVWLTAGLSLLLFWGSSLSKESDERVERKLDLLLRERGLEPTEVDARVRGELDGSRISRS